MITIERVDKYSDDVLRSVNELLPALSDAAALLDKPSLERILESDSIHLFLAKEDDRAVGMLTLVVFSVPTGTRARIEDVVVSEDARNQGIGQELVRAAIECVADMGARTLDLTSSPLREAANRLYQKCGFRRHNTNVYRRS